MLAPSTELLRVGVGLKLNQVKRATRSYLRDRTDQAKATASSYAIAAGLFVVAGIFVIAACLVGIDALFRWVEIKYGLFPAFGAIGALLIVLAALCAGCAEILLRRPARHFPSLTSRLRVALTASPIRSGQIDQAETRNVPATTMPSSSPRQTGPRQDAVPSSIGIDRNVQAGLAAAGILLGWVALRRRQQARRMAA
jgi:hypothetical protein